MAVMNSHPTVPSNNSMESSLAPSLPTRAGVWLLIGALVLLVIWTHWPLLTAQAHCFDDADFIATNPLVTRPSFKSASLFLTEVLNPSTVQGYYLPLSMISLMLDYAWGGRFENLRAFHITSLLLHTINTILLFLILHRLFRSRATAAIVAALFAVHPLTIEPLAWVGERKTLLAGFFSFASVLFYLRGIEPGRRKWLVGSVVLYALALMSKPTAIPLAAVLVIMDWWPLNRFNRKSITEKWPFFVVMILFGVISYLSHGNTAGIELTNATEDAPLPLVVCYLICFYLGKVIYPTHLCSVYPLPDQLSLSNPTIVLCVAVSILIALGLFLSLRRTRALVAGFLIFAVVISPTLGVIKYSWVTASDKYVYLPALGLLLAIAWGLAGMWKRDPGGRRFPRWAVLLFSVSMLATEVAASRSYAAKWKDTETLARHIVSLAPNSGPAYNLLGVGLNDAGHVEESLRQYREAIRLMPTYPFAHSNLANRLAGLSRFEEALHHLSIAAELRPRDGTLRYRLSLLLRTLGRKPEAIEQAIRASELLPDFPDASLQLSLVYIDAGRIDEAEAPLQRYLELEPDNAEAQSNYGGILLSRGRAQESIQHLERAIRLKPELAKALNNLGAALAGVGRAKEAIPHLREAVRLDPAWPAPAGALAWIRATHPDEAVRNADEAIGSAEKADQLTNHIDAPTIDTLAAACANAGRFDRAAALVREAIALVPEGQAAELVSAMRQRLALYEQKKPFRDASLAGRAGK